MDFSISPDLASLRDRIEAFVEAEILPVEADRANWDAHDNIAEAPLAALRAKARAEGLWCPQLSPANGGLDLGKMGMAVTYEAMNRSIFGPVVFNAAAPDDGNMMVLEALGTRRRRRAGSPRSSRARCARPSP
jgi:acyl-CoA dehydrogenase